MKTIPIKEITVAADRQRKEFDSKAQGELNDSILELGLLSPIILRRSGKGFVLVAGERRLRAVEMLSIMGETIFHDTQSGSDEPDERALVPLGEIPYLDLGELTTLQRMEIEYAENAFRSDLTWQEKALAIERLQALRKVQAEIKGTTHTLQALIVELHGDAPDQDDRDEVFGSLGAARHLENPAVAKASSLKEAVKIIRRQDDMKRREHLAGIAGAQTGTTRYVCHKTEAVTWLNQCPANTFDVILTDPPYGMDAQDFGDAAGRMSGIDHEYADGAVATRELLAACIPEWFRVAKPQAHLYIWCDIDMFTTLRELCRLAGWWTFRTPLINLKPSGGRVPWPEHGPRRSYELCLFAVKGKKPVTSIQVDYFESRLVEGNLGHGAQKPVEAYVNLLKRSCEPGNHVLDSFAGTGTIFAAAAQLQLTAVGTENNEAVFGICVERIEALK